MKTYADVLGSGNERPLEMSRKQWATAANLSKWYRMAAESLVEAKVAV